MAPLADITAAGMALPSETEAACADEVMTGASLVPVMVTLTVAVLTSPLASVTV